MPAAVSRQHVLEPGEELGDAVPAEILRAARRFGPLILVGEADSDRVMRVVRLRHHVGDGELDLMRPDPIDLVIAHEAEAWPEIEKDRGRLPDDRVAVPEEGWGVGWPERRRIFH